MSIKKVLGTLGLLAIGGVVGSWCTTYMVIRVLEDQNKREELLKLVDETAAKKTDISNNEN